MSEPKEHQDQGALETVLREGFQPGQAPVKLVTGRQETTGLNFDLKPGAIVAHPNSNVIFVCG
jgi:hypothetical protein